MIPLVSNTLRLRRVCLLAFVAIICLMAPTAPKGQDAFAVFQQVIKSVVRITVKGVTEDGNPVENSGTGFFVSSQGHILTAFHVVGKDRPGGEKVRWKTRADGKANPQIIVETWGENEKLETPDRRVTHFTDDDRFDFALLHLVGRNYPTVACDMKLQSDGTAVKGIGWRSGKNIYDSLEGIIIPSDPMVVGERYRINEPSKPGHSGGPIFNGSGEVVAMITSGEGGQVSPVGETYAMPIHWAMSILPASSRCRSGDAKSKRQIRIITPHKQLEQRGRILIYRKTEIVAELAFGELSGELAVGTYRAELFVQSRRVLTHPFLLTKQQQPKLIKIGDTTTITGIVHAGGESRRPVPKVMIRVGNLETYSATDGSYSLDGLPLRSNYRIFVYSRPTSAKFTESSPWMGLVPNPDWRTILFKNVRYTNSQ